jgi:hypothetical protein
MAEGIFAFSASWKPKKEIEKWLQLLIRKLASAAVLALKAARSVRSKSTTTKLSSPKANASNAVLASAAARPKPSRSDQARYGKEKSIGFFPVGFFSVFISDFRHIYPLLPDARTLV